MTQTSNNSDPKITPPNTATSSMGFLARHKMRVLIGGLILLTGTGVMLYTKSTAQANLNQEQVKLSRALMVETTPIKAQDSYQVRQKYTGRIVAGRESDHGFDRGGLLADVLVDEGQQVKKGDILARLDMRRLDARHQELTADLAQTTAQDNEAAAQLKRAQATFDRYKVLRNKQHVSAEKFDQVKFDLIGLKARKVATQSAISRTKAALNSLAVDRQMATLTARFNGSVIRRYQDEGAALGGGSPVIRLIEDQTLEIHLGLPPSALDKLSPDTLYHFDHQSGPLRAKLRATHARVDPATRTVTAIFDIIPLPGDKLVTAGTLAQLSLTQNIVQTGFWLPSDALAESRRGLWSVYTIAPYPESAPAALSTHGIVARQELQLLYTDSERVFVRGTLKDGDRIITGGLHRLVPGQLVQLMEGK